MQVKKMIPDSHMRSTALVLAQHGKGGKMPGSPTTAVPSSEILERSTMLPGRGVIPHTQIVGHTRAQGLPAVRVVRGSIIGTSHATRHREGNQVEMIAGTQHILQVAMPGEHIRRRGQRTATPT